MRPIRITVVHRGTGESKLHEFRVSPVRIGRNPLNDLALRYPFVSGWHAVVRFDDDAARFFDLGSTNGTLKDGRRVVVGEEVAFEQPVTIQMGDLDLIMARAGASAEAVPSGVPMPAGARDGAASATRGTSAGGTIGGAVPITPDADASIHAGIIDTDQAARNLPPSEAGATMQLPMGLVHEAMAALRPLHERMRDARLRFEQELHGRVHQLPAHARDAAEQFMRREFQIAPGGSNAPAPGSSGALVALAEHLLPQTAPPASALEIERFSAGLRDVLEACAKSLVELQKGQEQFGHEMGVKAIKEFTPLHVAGSAREVLEYLLDFRHGDPHRIQELVGVFADIMIHQVALLNGVAEGARALLASLHPDEIERRAASGWGRKAAHRWKTFVARHHELSSEDRLWMEIMFGPEFARAYAEVGGEQKGNLAREPLP